MKKLNKIKWLFLTFIFITLPALILVPSATAAFRYLHEGMKIPDVVGQNALDNSEVSSTVYLNENNMMIIVFWATWSKRSIEELQALKEISSEFKDKPVQIIAVNVDNLTITKEKRASIQSLLTDMDLPFPCIIDNKLELYYKFGVIAVPSTAITDSTGIIRYGPAGYSLTTRDLIVDSILVLLGLKDVSAVETKKGYVPQSKSLRYFNLALNLYHKRLFKRALENLETAIESDPKFPAPYSLKGEIFLQMDSLEAAYKEFNTAVSLDTEFVAARTGLGKTLYSQGKIDEAIESLSATLTYDDTYTPAMTALSSCYLKQDNFEKAMELLNTAQEFNPKEPSLFYYKSKINIKSNDMPAAIDNMKTALELYFPIIEQ